MKKLFLIVFVMMFITGLFAAGKDLDVDPNASATAPAPTDYLFDAQFDWPLVNPDGLSVGIETDGVFIYTCHWQNSLIYRYDMDGLFIETFDIGVSLTRDLAYNPSNGYFYGADATTNVKEMDFTQGAELLVRTFTAPTAIRAIGFDDVNGWLFGNNWSTDVYVFDLTGATQYFFTVSANSYYGFAYDNHTAGGPYIWGFAQMSAGSREFLIQMDAATGAETGLTYDVGTALGHLDAELAGGLAITPPGTFPSVDPTKWSFFGITQNTYMWAIELDEQNPCTAPTNLAATNVTETSADLGWTETGTATSWEVEYGTAGFVQGAGTTIAPATNPQAISGLVGSTGYDFYVRSDCGGGSFSNWSIPASFNTPCATFATPHTETFDTATLPICWLIDPVVVGDSWEVTNYDVGGHGAAAEATGNGGYMLVIDDSSPETVPAHLYTPLFDTSTLTVPQLTFSYWIGDNSNTSELHVDIITSGGTVPSVAVITVPAGSSAWATYTIDLPTYAGQTIGFDFRGMESTSFYGDICFDDFALIEAPTCLAPINLAATNVTETSADLGWTETGTATSWDVEWGPAGFVQGAGTMIDPATNPQALAGLTSGTAYDYYVRADCGGGEYSTWENSSFTTAYPPTDCDWYIIGYDSYGDSWNGGNIDIVINGTLMYNWAGPATTGPETFTFGIYEASTIDLIWNSGSYDSEVTYDLYNNQDVIVFSDGTYPTGTTGIYGTCIVPLCPPPTDLATTNVTATSADLGWVVGGTEALWDVRWGLTGFDPNAFPPGGTLEGGLTVTNHALTGLAAYEVYDWYVRADCVPEVSIWVGPMTFTAFDQNNDCASALVVGEVTDLAYDTSAGWVTPSGFGGYITSNDLFYSFTAPADGLLDVDLCGSTFDTKLAIFDDCVPTNTLFTNDDACGLQSGLYGMPVVGGEDYIIQVGGYSTASGPGDITTVFTATPPAAPTGVDIAVNLNVRTDAVEVTWTVIAGLTYNVYSSDDPEAAFPAGWTLVETGNTTGTYSEVTVGKMFFVVTANN